MNVAAAGYGPIFHLHRAVVNVEFVFQAPREGSQPSCVGPAGAHEVGHEGRVVTRAAQAPDVQVVHGLHLRLAEQKLPHGLGVDAVGHALQAQARLSRSSPHEP